jgi:hypothetical protein
VLIATFLIVAMPLAGCRSGGMPASTTAAEPAKAPTPGAAETAKPAPATSTTPAPTPAAAAGYDLYSWQAGGAWHFSLLPGANRLRSFDEIQNAEVSVEGVSALKSKLRKLPAGEKVKWSARVANTEMPNKETVDDVSRYATQVGLDLTVTE